MSKLRRRLHARDRYDAITVTISGCVRTCPPQAERTAVVLAGASEGCREWAVDLESTAELDGIAEALCRGES